MASTGAPGLTYVLLGKESIQRRYQGMAKFFGASSCEEEIPYLGSDDDSMFDVENPLESQPPSPLTSEGSTSSLDENPLSIENLLSAKDASKKRTLPLYFGNDPAPNHPSCAERDGVSRPPQDEPECNTNTRSRGFDPQQIEDQMILQRWICERKNCQCFHVLNEFRAESMRLASDAEDYLDRWKAFWTLLNCHDHSTYLDPMNAPWVQDPSWEVYALMSYRETWREVREEIVRVLNLRYSMTYHASTH